LDESTIGFVLPLVLSFTAVVVVSSILSRHFGAGMLLYVHITFRYCCVSTNFVVLSLTLHPLLLTLYIAVVSFSGTRSCFIGKRCTTCIIICLPVTTSIVIQGSELSEVCINICFAILLVNTT
jgi:hypothetical protein